MNSLQVIFNIRSDICLINVFIDKFKATMREDVALK